MGQNEYRKTVHMNNIPSEIWKVLTDTELMKNWMGEPEMNVRIYTDWVIGNPFIIKGFHHADFENTGSVLHYEPYKKLRYSSKSSLSHLPDKPENYTIIEFVLDKQELGTILTLTVYNFPTYAIQKHYEFYWNTTIELLKRYIEN